MRFDAQDDESVPFPAVLCNELAVLMVGKGRDDLTFTDQRAACCGTPTGVGGNELQLGCDAVRPRRVKVCRG
ncbi:hypothetical protein [Mycobacterium sp.]|uniref:hypothetical protein n=1 Tax=Mycobacterium sp. TaxID=1785 RepID=UPI003F98ED37